jgi:hypothetical protein
MMLPDSGVYRIEFEIVQATDSGGLTLALTLALTLTLTLALTITLTLTLTLTLALALTPTPKATDGDGAYIGMIKPDANRSSYPGSDDKGIGWRAEGIV